MTNPDDSLPHDPLKFLTDAELQIELIADRVKASHHQSRCGARCQDYREAAASVDEVLDEMGRRLALLPA